MGLRDAMRGLLGRGSRRSRARTAVAAPGSRYVVEALEPRILLSADPLGGALADAALPPLPDPDDLDVDAFLASVEPPPPVQAPLELVFVDADLPDAEQLIADLMGDAEGRRFEVVTLDGSRDGIEQIGEALADRRELAAVHVVSHGEAGRVTLGASDLDLATLAEREAEIAAWSDAFAADGDLLFYGCELGASAEGRALVDAVAGLTGADVAASDDLTGAEALGGDWALEVVSGAVETGIAFSADTQASWRGTLATINVTQTLDVVNGDTSSIAALLGPGGDGGDGISLREAVLAINTGSGGDEIVIAAGTYRLTLGDDGEEAGAEGDLDLNENVTIRGAGSAATIIDGDGNDRVFHFRSGANVASIEGLTITNGDTGGRGGGVYSQGATLDLTDVVFLSNQASNDGGAIYSDRDLSLDRVIFQGNTSFGDGGAIMVDGALSGSDVVVTGNTSNNRGGGIRVEGSVDLVQATIAGNTASNEGGGIYARDPAVDLTNVTISGNTGQSGGGVWVDQGASFTSATIVANRATVGAAGVHSNGAASDVTFFSTLLADNTGGFGTTNQTFRSLGNSIEDGSSAFSGGFFNQQNVAGLIGQLGPLQSNGGSTPTHALLAGSDAINAGPLIGAPLTDQRGFGRFLVADVGAYEANGIVLGNLPPTDISPDSFSVDENVDTTGGYALGTLTATDPNSGETFNWSIQPGGDGALFSVDASDRLVIADGVLDYESQSSYTVNVRVTDSGGATHDETLTVDVNDLNEAPTVSLTPVVTNLDEDVDTSTAIRVATIDVTDDALGTNDLTLSGTDAGLFRISGVNLQLRPGAVLDFETNPVLDVTVEVDDSALAPDPNDTAAYSVTIDDVNEAPTVSLTPVVTNLDEDADTTLPTTVATITVNDDALGTNDLTLSGTDAGLFQISGGNLQLRAGVTLDFETNPSLDVTVEVDDSALAPDPNDTAAYSVTIDDVNEAPTVSLTPVVTNLDEDADTTLPTTVATITVTDDALGTNDLTLSGTDAGLFQISGGNLQLRAGVSLDHETNPVLDVTVEVDDSALLPDPNDTAAYSVTVDDVNEPPTVTLTPVVTNLDEDASTATATTVATITVNDDALGTNDLTLAGADAGLFQISGSALQLRAGVTLDFETNPSLDVTVRVDDPATLASPDDSAAYAVTVNDVNEAPRVTLTPLVGSLNEDTDTTLPITVGTVSVSDDALGSRTVRLAGADAGLFQLSGSALQLRAGAILDAAANPNLDVTVEVDDPALAPDPDDAGSMTIRVDASLGSIDSDPVPDPGDDPDPTPDPDPDPDPDPTPDPDPDPDPTPDPEPELSEDVALLAVAGFEVPDEDDADDDTGVTQLVGATDADADAEDAALRQDTDDDDGPVAMGETPGVQILLERLMSPAEVSRVEGVLDEFDRMRRELGEERVLEKMVMGSVGGGTTALAAGYVLWLLRGGALLGSMLSSLPAWQMIDPLPVLASGGAIAGDHDDDESLEEMVQNADGEVSEEPSPTGSEDA